MKLLSVMLARQAEVDDNLLNVTGAGFSTMTVTELPGTFRLAVGGLLVDEPVGSGASGLVRLEFTVRRPDGSVDSNPVAHDLAWQVQAAGVNAGELAVVPFALEVPVTCYELGRHFVLVILDGQVASALPVAVDMDGAAR